MGIIVGSVIFAALLIVLSKVAVVPQMAKQKGGYDNHYPRDQQAALIGFGKRAYFAHNNCIEAFPLFAVGVLMAMWAKADVTLIQNLCVVFSSARVAYVVCYWLDLDSLRSTFWSVGFICSLWLMALAFPL